MNHLVVSLMRQANTALSEMFDHYTTSEWIEQKVYPMFSKLSQIRRQSDELKTIKSWPSRPYPPLQALTDMGIGLPQSSSTTEREPVYNRANNNKNYVDFRKKSTKSSVYYSSKPQKLSMDSKIYAQNGVQNNFVYKKSDKMKQDSLGAGSSQYVRLSNHL